MSITPKFVSTLGTAAARALRSVSGTDAHCGANAALPRLVPNSVPDALSMHHRPGTVAIVDDDPDFLEMMAMTMPRDWTIEPYERPSSCLVALQEEQATWEEDLWRQQQIVHLWHLGAPLIPQILRYFEANRNRRAFTRVAVVDYMMPGLSGLELLRDLPGLHAQRILLAGFPDDTLATAAFNGGLIDHFLLKQSPRFRSNLVAAVEKLAGRPNARHHQLWWATLQKGHAAMLLDRAVTGEISAFLHKHFVEWIVIGQPFGVVALDGAGHAHWVQLEPRAHLNELAELAADDGASPDQIEAIKRGDRLSNVELRREMGMRGSDWGSPLAVGERQDMLAAVYAIAGLGARQRPVAGPRSGNQSTF